jgi:hypothetical protein
MSGIIHSWPIEIDFNRAQIRSRIKETDILDLKSEASYIVFTDGLKYYAKNGSTGIIEYSDTDASNVIQYAINSLPSYGGKIFIKAGTYILLKTVGLFGKRYDTLLIQGEGMRATVLKLAGNVNSDMLHFTPPSGAVMTPVIIRDLGIDGNKANNTSGNGIVIEDAACCVIERIRVINVAGHGVWLKAGSIARGYYNYIRDNEIVGNNGDGIKIDYNIDSNIIIGNLIANNGGNGIRTDVGWNLIVGNYIASNTVNIYLYGDNNHLTKIVGNHISESLQENIKIEAVGTPSFYIVIVGNVIAYPGRSATNYQYSSVKIINARRILIANNVFAYDYPKYVIEESGIADLNIITDNILHKGNSPNPAVYRTGTGTIVKRNIFYVTENSGVATITAGSTRVTVSHGLATTPSKILITPLAQPPGKLWVENITSTSFDIVTDTAPTSNLNVAWYAEI